MGKTNVGRRKERQERLRIGLWGLALVGVGAYLLLDTRMGAADLRLWRFWPILLLLAGLPPLLLPTGDANQTLGLLLTGFGVLLQLRNLDLVAWSFGHAWPLLLIGAGVLLIVRSRRTVTTHAVDRMRCHQ